MLSVADWVARDNKKVDDNDMTATPNTSQAPRKLGLTLGAVALAGLAAFAAGCSNSESPSPTTPPTSTISTTTTATPTATETATPPVETTEKAIDPTGGNLFTPEIKAPAAPTEPPGVHRNN